MYNIVCAQDMCQPHLRLLGSLNNDRQWPWLTGKTTKYIYTSALYNQVSGVLCTCQNSNPLGVCLSLSDVLLLFDFVACIIACIHCKNLNR
jgi:hypothetical protein